MIPFSVSAPSDRLPLAWRALLALSAWGLALGCGDILDVEDPDNIPPETLDNPSGAGTLYNGAIGDYAVAVDGENSTVEGQILVSELLTDMWMNSETFPTRQEMDRRRMDTRNVTLLDVFRNLNRARVSAERAATALETFSPDGAADPRIPEMRSLAAYTYVHAGENYCSGVPFSTTEPDITFGEPLTTAQIFDSALARFDLALAAPGVTPEVASLASVGKGRALLNLGQFAEAAAAVVAVPTEFRFVSEHSLNTERQENAVYRLNVDAERWSVANLDGGTGLPYRDAADPRVPFFLDPTDGVGFDASTPQFNLLKYDGPEAPITVADGVEARLIEAEAALQAGDAVTWLGKLNELRAALTTLRPETPGTLAPLADPGTADARLDLTFSERAFWFFATGHRLGDLRRLVRQYGRDTEAVFPTGAYFKGGEYGPDVNLPIPFDELNNPRAQSGCLDRNA
jgi:starch-binding outer membrane protein, SusD/RagB family